MGARRSLPFPLLFDSAGATHRAWGIETCPTTLLVDPAGNIVAEGGIDDLAKRIGL
jgi:peroxiredoxin